MEYWKMKTLLMVAFVGLSRVNSRLTVTPSDAEVVNGTWVTLNCSTDSTSPIIWIKEDEGGFNNKTVFNGSSIAAEFNASYDISRPKQGSFNLEFLATEETASVYRCENEGDSSSAKLDIIESPGQPIMSELRNNYQRHDLRQRVSNFLGSRPTWARPEQGPPKIPKRLTIDGIKRKLEHENLRRNNHGSPKKPEWIIDEDNRYNVHHDPRHNNHEPPGPPEIPEWSIDDDYIIRYLANDDLRRNNHESPRKEMVLLPSLEALENLNSQSNLRHGGNTEPQSGPGYFAMIFTVFGVVVGVSCLLSVCKYCCCALWKYCCSG